MGKQDIGERRDGHDEVECGHDVLLVHAIGERTSDGREEDVGEKRARDDDAVEGGRSREVQEVERHDELEDVLPEQREQLRCGDGGERGSEKAVLRFVPVCHDGPFD